MAGVTLAYVLGCAGTWMIAQSGYAGAPINGDRATIRYALGAPDAFRGDEPTWSTEGDSDAALFWQYELPKTLVSFDPVTDRSTSITCLQDARSSGAPCPGVLGVRIGDLEQDVLEVIGTPTSSSISNGRKTLHYEEVGYDFVLERLRVIGVRSTPSEGGALNSLGRFLIWLVP